MISETTDTVIESVDKELISSLSTTVMESRVSELWSRVFPAFLGKKGKQVFLWDMSKRQERSSSSGSESSIKMETKLRRIEDGERATLTTGEITLAGIHTALELLSTRIESSFSDLSNKLSTFRHEIQTDIKEIKQNISGHGKSLEAVWSRSEEAE